MNQPQNVAMEFAGEPVLPRIGGGAAVSRKSQRCRAAPASASASRSQLSKRCTPRGRFALSGAALDVAAAGDISLALSLSGRACQGPLIVRRPADPSLLTRCRPAVGLPGSGAVRPSTGPGSVRTGTAIRISSISNIAATTAAAPQQADAMLHRSVSPPWAMRGHHLPRAARGETRFPCDPLRDRLNKNRPRRIRDATAGFHRRAERGGVAAGGTGARRDGERLPAWR